MEFTCNVFLFVLLSFLKQFLDPASLIPYIPKYGLAIEVNADGDVIGSVHDPTGETVSSTSEILALDETTIIVGSFHAPFLLRIKQE